MICLRGQLCLRHLCQDLLPVGPSAISGNGETRLLCADGTMVEQVIDDFDLREALFGAAELEFPPEP